MKRLCLLYLLAVYFLASAQADGQYDSCGQNSLSGACSSEYKALYQSGTSCIWIANDLGFRNVCQNAENGALPAVLKDKEDYNSVQAIIGSTIPRKMWIDMSYDGKTKTWYRGPHKEKNKINNDDSRIHEITQERWGMQEIFELTFFTDTKCLAAELKHKGYFTKDFKTTVSYTLRDCNERLPFFCFKDAPYAIEKDDRQPEWKKFDYEFFSRKMSNTNKGAMEFCPKYRNGYYLLYFWKQIGDFNHFFQYQFSDTLMNFHLGIEGFRGLFMWTQPPAPWNNYKGYDKLFQGYEKTIDGVKGDCISFDYDGVYRTNKCGNKRAKKFNTICQSPLDPLGSHKQELKVHYKRRNRKFLRGERVKLDCSGDTRERSDSITWKVVYPNGTIDKATERKLRRKPTAVSYVINYEGFCVKHLYNRLEFYVEDHLHGKSVNCYIPSIHGERYDHCDPRYCKGLTFDLIEMPLRKPKLKVSYPGYPGEVYQGRNVHITCTANYSFEKFTKREKNSLVITGSVKESIVVTVNKLKNMSGFEIRTFHQYYPHNRQWFEKFKTMTHTLSVEVTFKMTVNLIGLTLDCFGVDVDYHELPKSCKQKDPYCIKSGVFEVRPAPIYEGVPRIKNYFAFYIVITILSLLLFSVLFIPCKPGGKDLQPEADPFDDGKKKPFSYRDIFGRNIYTREEHEPADGTYKGKYGYEATYNADEHPDGDEQKIFTYGKLFKSKDRFNYILGARRTSTTASCISSEV